MNQRQRNRKEKREWGRWYLDITKTYYNLILLENTQDKKRDNPYLR